MDVKAPSVMPDEQMSVDGARVEPRTNMFIAAVLHSGIGAGPVRIRNLSPSGALIEGPVLPSPGERVALARGDLRVSGTVAWSADGRCGMRLNGAITVAEWMTNPTQRHQGQVDRLIADIKGGLTPGPSAAPGTPPVADIRDDIDRLRLLLEAMGEDLAGAPETLMRHTSSLQNLDIAGQMLDALKQALDPEPERRRAGVGRLLGLRHSTDGAMRNAA